MFRLSTIQGFLFLGVFLLLGQGACVGQSTSLVMFGGGGVNNQGANNRSSLHVGGDFEATMPLQRGQFPWGVLIEGGYVGPITNNKGSAILSTNYVLAFRTVEAKTGGFAPGKVVPFLTGGYTRLFGTGNAVNFGGGIDVMLHSLAAVRFEVRDYLNSADQNMHDVGFRIGWVLYPE